MTRMGRAFTVVLCAATWGCTTVPSKDAATAEGLTRANRAYGAGQWQAARAEYEAVLRHDRTNPEIWFRLGNIDQRQGHWDAAEERYRRVIALQPRHERAYYNLAVVYLTRAEQHFQYFSALSELDAESDHLTALLGAIGRFADAGAEPATPLDRLGQLLRQERTDLHADERSPDPARKSQR